MNPELGAEPAGAGGWLSERWLNLILIGACVVLAVLVLLLARQNRELKAELAETQRAQLPPGALRPGDRLYSLDLLDTAGNRQALTFSPDGPRSVLLAFSTDCQPCRDTLPIWSTLLADVPASSRVVPILLGGEIGEVPFLPFAVFTPEDAGASLAARIPSVPATLVLGPEGEVEKAWYGVLDDRAQRELRAAIE